MMKTIAIGAQDFRASPWLRNAGIAAVCGLFLGVTGPFGSYLNPSHGLVVIYWVGAVLLGEAMIGQIIRPAAILAARRRVPPAAAIACATMLMAVPLSLICRVAAMALWPAVIARVGPLAWYGQTLVVAAGLAAAHHLVAARRTQAPACPPAPPPSDFFQRIPASLGRDLLALQMEDHYVRVHTATGSALVLIPLRQALEEVACIPGLKVHRSWWVSRRAVVGTAQDGRNLRLRLANGLVAPVSRAQVSAVKRFMLS